jgi:hypothetical protein
VASQKNEGVFELRVLGIQSEAEVAQSNSEIVISDRRTCQGGPYYVSFPSRSRSFSRYFLLSSNCVPSCSKTRYSP